MTGRSRMRACAAPADDEPMELLERLPILLAAVAFAIGVHGTLVGRRRVGQALRESFAALRFATPDGSVGGDAVRVVKVYRQGMPLAYDDVFDLPIGPRRISDSFWYCVGPGPTYFVAIPMVEVGLGRAKVTWVVRELSEARMRAALVDDPEALAPHA